MALVTGSASGIGEAIARRLAAEGARVMIHGQPRQAQEAAAIVADAFAKRVATPTCDLADLEDPAACARLIEAVIAALRPARHSRQQRGGHPARRDSSATDAAFFDRAIAVNVRAPLLLIRAAWPHMRAQGGGRVLNIGSINAYCGEPVLLAYSISKGGLTTLTRNLADAHAREGLRINQINPGWVLTENEYQTQGRRRIERGLADADPARTGAVGTHLSPGGDRAFRGACSSASRRSW